MCQWMMKVCLPWTRQDIRTIQRNTIHFQKGTRSTLTRGQIYCQALEILGNRFEIMSENKKQKNKKPIWKKMLRDVGKKKKCQIDALDRFDQQFQNIRKEKKNKQKFPRVVYQKKILEHTTISFPLLHSAGLIILTFFLISKK